MDLYYKYSHNPNGKKYAPMTKTEYLAVKSDPNRWFINFGNCIMECERSEYTAYYRLLDHYQYTKRKADGHRAEVISLDEAKDLYSYEESVFSVHTEQTPDDETIERLLQEYRKNRLITAFESMLEDEVYLLEEIVLRSRTQSDLANEMHISHQAISKRLRKIMRKLRAMLQDLE